VKHDRDNRLGPPPIEPLSDVSWQRVEKRLFAQLDLDASAVDVEPVRPRRAWQPWAAAGGLALACAAIALVLLRPSTSSHLAHLRDAGVPAPSRVVAQDSATEVSYGEATITVDAESAVTMSGDAASGVLIILERGSATFAVAPRHQRPPFTVLAGEVMVKVIGTRFTVSRSGDAARVDVIEGHVEVVSRGHRVQVRAGESWSSNDDREAVVQDPDMSPSGIAAAPFVSTDGQPLGGGRPGDLRSADGSVNDGLPREGQSSAGAATTTPDRTTRSRPRQRTSRLDDTPQARYERAAALEASDARSALVSYREIAKGKGAWAANALYAAGRLAAELGDHVTAVKFLRAYVARFPRGANVADARALLDSLGE